MLTRRVRLCYLNYCGEATKRTILGGRAASGIPRHSRVNAISWGSSVDRRHSRSVFVLVLILPVLSSCGRSNRPLTQAPPPIDTSTPAANRRPVALDPLAQVLINARDHTQRGERLLRDGNVNEARDAFETALEVLRAYTPTRSRSFEFEREIDFLNMRLAALGPTPVAEPAMIDDLATLDAPIEDGYAALRERTASDIASITSDLPIQLHHRVLELLIYFTEGHGRRAIELGLRRVGLYRPLIQRILNEEGLPQDLVYLAQAESAFKPEALSRAQAKGMWQFIASRGREYELRQNWWIDERSDPEKSTRAAARHLKDLYQEFGHWYLAMAAYNAGPARVSRAVEQASSRDFWALADRKLLPQETRNYVPTILAMTIIGKNPARYGFAVRPADPIEMERVRVPHATDLRVIAENLNLSVERIQELNPHVLRWATPPDDDEFELNVPVGLAALFAEKVATLPESERIQFHHHVVANGETLSQLVNRYGVSMTLITGTNGIANQNMIRAGQTLVIPVRGVSRADGGAETPAVAPASSTDRPAAYQIRRGDTLIGIATRFALSINEIKAWNGMSSNLLIAGQSLRLPPASTPATSSGNATRTERVVYQVRPGDTLFQIAMFYRTSVDDIRAWNPDSDLSVIRPGDQITIHMPR